MSENFGAGPALDGKFDFSVDSTGDLNYEGGVSELEKDLSFQMVISLQEFLGQPPSGNLQEKVLGKASRIAISDPRVSFVDKQRSEVQFAKDRKALEIKLIIETGAGAQRLVFNI